MRDHTNEKVLGQANDATTYKAIVGLHCPESKCYSFNHLTLDAVKKKKVKKTLKGVSKVVVKSK